MASVLPCGLADRDVDAIPHVDGADREDQSSPGVVVIVDGRAVSVMAFDVDGERIAGIDAFAGPGRVAELVLPA